MDPLPSPREPLEPELGIEPVIGWRLWRLAPDGKGDLALKSPIQDFLWPPMQPTRAACPLHRAPDRACSCGLYATSRLERLPSAGAAFTGRACAAAGSVALWGTVVEHAAGYRAELGYPDRLRLVCGSCFGEGRDGVPTRVFLSTSGELIPTCSTHAPVYGGKRSAITPAELERELLSRYAVDLLPLERLHAVGFGAGPPSVPTRFVMDVRAEARRLRRSPAGWLGVAALVLAFLIVRALGLMPSPDVTNEPTASPSPVAVASFSSGPQVRPRPDLVEPDAPNWKLAFICGHRVGATVELRSCDRKAGVVGFASSPPEPRKECDPGTAYTRKKGLSVCWLDSFAPKADLQTWWLPGVHWKDVEAA